MEIPKETFLKTLNNDEIEKFYEASLNHHSHDNTHDNINNETPINKVNYQLYKKVFFDAVEQKFNANQADASAVAKLIDNTIYNKSYKTNTTTLKQFDVLYYDNTFYICFDVTDDNSFDLFTYIDNVKTIIKIPNSTY
jgi:hypothetical protein